MYTLLGKRECIRKLTLPAFQKSRICYRKEMQVNCELQEGVVIRASVAVVMVAFRMSSISVSLRNHCKNNKIKIRRLFTFWRSQNTLGNGRSFRPSSTWSQMAPAFTYAAIHFFVRAAATNAAVISPECQATYPKCQHSRVVFNDICRRSHPMPVSQGS
jgi:hypothetical protein